MQASMSAYDFFKDFSSPVATISAAAVAAVVTYYFNKRQTMIASAQAEIAASRRDVARDRLKFDLFKQRYEVYQAAESLIVIHMKMNSFNDALEKTEELRDLYVKIGEARFFFEQEVCEFLKKLHDTLDAFYAEVTQPRTRGEETITENPRQKKSSGSDAR